MLPSLVNNNRAVSVSLLPENDAGQSFIRHGKIAHHKRSEDSAVPMLVNEKDRPFRSKKKNKSTSILLKSCVSTGAGSKTAPAWKRD